MSKMTEKMKEVENVVNVEPEKVENVENETEEFMTVRIPKAKAYEMLANGEAEEADIEAPEKEEVKEKKSIFSRLKNSKVAKGIAITAAVVGGVVTGVALGKNNKNSDDVTFEDVPPQGLPNNDDNFKIYDLTVDTKEEEV